MFNEDNDHRKSGKQQQSENSLGYKLILNAQSKVLKC